jgi:hypothetical protein
MRVIVITGQRDGEFHVAPRPAHYDVKEHCDRLNPIRRVEKIHPKPNRGVIRAIEALALCEIPVIARLNGDAIGFGQSVMFGCDIIIAREDAVISDVHLAQGEVIDRNGERRAFPWGVMPGDSVLTFFAVFHIVEQMNIATDLALESEFRDFVDHARLGGGGRWIDSWTERLSQARNTSVGCKRHQGGGRRSARLCPLCGGEDISVCG